MRRAAFRMFKEVVAESGGYAARPVSEQAQDSSGTEAGPHAAELAARVRELEAQLRQRDEEIRVLASMRRPTTVSRWRL